MKKNLQNTLFIMAFIPMLVMMTTGLNTGSPDMNTLNNVFISKENTSNSGMTEDAKDVARKEKADILDKYFKDRSMPLEGHGMQFVLVAEKYGLPYNFLPAIAIRESSGGKFDCYNNPFGWGSCKIKFSSYDEAIEKVGKSLAGADSKTSRYYANTSVKTKLYKYNGTVISGYEDQVIAIMRRIDNDEF